MVRLATELESKFCGHLPSILQVCCWFTLGQQITNRGSCRVPEFLVELATSPLGGKGLYQGLFQRITSSPHHGFTLQAMFLSPIVWCSHTGGDQTQEEIAIIWLQLQERKVQKFKNLAITLAHFFHKNSLNGSHWILFILITKWPKFTKKRHQ
jgi:hypothetical protein